MLQQTRVAAVIEHYREFLRRFPTVQKLAAAREASVLAAWSGLGYYRRARMLHAAARLVAREGKFPETAEGWRELPGIGRYTAAAIASIAFAEPVAVVDGNVERVLERVLGEWLTGERLWETAAEFLDKTRPGDFNQAMMELGATVCTPRGPACLACPVVGLCAARGELAGAAKTARQKKREIHYALDVRDGAVFLVQRPWDASLMAGMWELPETDAPVKTTGEKQVPFGALRLLRAGSHRRFASVRNVEDSGDGRSGDVPLLLRLKHSITVTDYTVHVWSKATPERMQGKWIRAGRLGQVPLTGLSRKILRKAGFYK